MGIKTQGGVTSAYTAFYCLNQFVKSKKSLVFVVPRDGCIHDLVDQLKAIAPAHNVLSFPGWDCLPYDRVSPSSDITHIRLSTLYALLESKVPFILITSVSGIGQRLPPPSLMKAHNHTLSIGDKVSRDSLLALLIEQGCNRVEAVYEMGEFAVRGGLIDVFAPGAPLPVRLDFFGDELESIKSFDPITQKTNQTGELVELSMRAAHEVLLTADNITQFRQQYRALFGGSRAFPADDPLYQHISEGRPYPGMEHWLPLFFEQTATLFDYIGEQANILFDDGVDNAIQHRLEAIDDYYKARLSPPLGDVTPYNPIASNLLYWQAADWQQFTEAQSITQLSPFKTDEDAINLKIAPSFKAERDQSTTALFDAVDNYLSAHKERNRIITCMSEGTRDRQLH
ncbi:MAG: transcription-repair coupling factor, partial [Pseudomonadota bacterium]|nr:transcription-repair coupling factor [Pseudomonadota bacterium]